MKNIIFIPVKGISSADFDIDAEKKLELIQLGKYLTNQFLKKWAH